MDLGVVTHLSSVKSRLPFLNFFDGYRTSAEISKIEPITYDAMASIFPYDSLKEHLHKYALNPNSPLIRGTGQRPDIYFQNAVAAHSYYLEAPAIVEEVLPFYFIVFMCHKISQLFKAFCLKIYDGGLNML